MKQNNLHPMPQLDKHLSLRLPYQTFEQLVLVARFNRITPSELLRLIVDDWMTKQTGRKERVTTLSDVVMPTSPGSRDAAD